MALKTIEQTQRKEEEFQSPKVLPECKSQGQEIREKHMTAQKRADFRLDSPPGTRIHFLGNVINHDWSVVNISLGGALIGPEIGIQKAKIFKKGQILSDIKLQFPLKKGLKKRWKTVQVKEAIVMSLAQAPKTNEYRYAIKFTEIEKSERTALRDIIYELQRKLLQERSQMP